MNSVLGMILISVGLIFDLIACLGLVRLRDVYNRLEASTKCVTLGTCSILLGTFLIAGFSSQGMKILLCMAFVLLVSPVTAHALARGAHRAGVKPCEGSGVDAYAEDREGEA